MTVELKATLTKNPDSSWSVELIGDQLESAKALFDFLINKGLVEVRDQPDNISKKLVLTRNGYHVSANLMEMGFKVDEGYSHVKYQK